MVRKDRSTFVNKTAVLPELVQGACGARVWGKKFLTPNLSGFAYLLIMLPIFYQTHLKSQFNPTEYLLLKIVINLLKSIKKVSLEALVTALPIPITFESRRKKIQRFL